MYLIQKCLLIKFVKSVQPFLALILYLFPEFLVDELYYKSLTELFFQNPYLNCQF